MTTLPTESPTRARLLQWRFSERQRLADLRRRLGQMDPGRHPRAFEAMQEAVRASANQLAAIEAELAGEVEVAVPGNTAQQGRDQMRARLHHLELVIERHAPPSCRRAAANLRRAIHTELRRLDTTRTKGRIGS
jgi:hypothetical protein